MVGSIFFVKQEGECVKKGDEVCNLSFYSHYVCFPVGMGFHFHLNLMQFGYFSFGGSTCICVFEKIGQIFAIFGCILSMANIMELV